MSNFKSQIGLLSFVLSLWAVNIFAEDLPEGFYNSVNGLKDCALKGTLKELIRNHTVIPYGEGSWEVFYYADQDENGYCMDMYCDDWKKFGAPGSAVSGCNVEHSFAKSWWGGAKNDAYKDCYHLNPSNSVANSARSNYPLGIVTNLVKTAGSLKIGKQHHDSLNVDFNIWEPKDEYKGDFARAYFYMATCYGKDKNGAYDPTICSAYQGWRLDNKDVGSKFAMQNDNYLEFQPWEQEVLITWHRQDPVSVKEIKRADAVSNFQHNRNPFIDYPYLAEFIWGEKAGEELNLADLMGSFEADFIPGQSNGWRGDITPVTPKPKYGVTWSVNGEEIYVDSITENKKVTALPETPESCSTESTEFMGWTSASIRGTLDEAPAILYTSVAQIPAVTADVTYYAVFAHKTIEEGGDVLKETTFTFTKTETTVTQEDVSVTFAKAGGSNEPKYYDNGSAIRCYAKNTITVSAPNVNSIEFTFGSGDGSNEINVNVGTFSGNTWTGNADEVVFTIGGSSGHRRIAGMKVVYNGQGSSVIFDKYLTNCSGGTDIENSQLPTAIRKFIRSGQLLIQVGDQIYTITGQKVQ